MTKSIPQLFLFFSHSFSHPRHLSCETSPWVCTLRIETIDPWTNLMRNCFRPTWSVYKVLCNLCPWKRCRHTLASQSSSRRCLRFWSRRCRSRNTGCRQAGGRSWGILGSHHWHSNWLLGSPPRRLWGGRRMPMMRNASLRGRGGLCSWIV